MAGRPPIKWCRTVGEVPAGPHFVILKSGGVHVPDAPGYPGGRESYLDYMLFVDEAAWKAEVEELVKKGEKDWKAVRVDPAEIVTSVSVSVKMR